MTKTNLKERLNGKVQAISNEPLAETIITETKNEITVIDSSYTVLNTNVIDIINENLKNNRLSRQSIDIIKSPSGGAQVFTIPSLSGFDVEKELVGVILDYSTPRAYWDSSDPVEGTPPTCFSADSTISYEGKPCSRCMHNEYGSKDGESNAKACKEMVELYLLRDNNIMPVIVRVPVSSKTIFQKYITRLVSCMIPLCGVVTKITLEKAVSRAGQPYAKFNFEALNLLTPDETNGFRTFGKKIMEIINTPDETEIKEAS